MTVKIAVIGGSGFYSMSGSSEKVALEPISTPYGEVSGLYQYSCSGQTLLFLPRHGGGHKVPPHKINYRANIYALKSLGVESIIATNAVGGIGRDCSPGTLVLADQIIDYTWGRECTFFDKFDDGMSHIDFTEPFSGPARAALQKGADAFRQKYSKGSLLSDGVYACMQGPRLETSAEIRKLQNDGATLVGMTVMPEAALARELELDYASICLVVNWAAGLSEGPITMEAIIEQLNECVTKAEYLIGQSVNYFYQ